MKRLIPGLFVVANLAILSLSGCNRAETFDTAPFNAAQWEKQLKSPKLTEAQFTRLYAQAVAAELKNASVKITGPREVSVKLPDGTEFKSFLDNAWTEAVNAPAARPDICRRYLKALSASFPGMSKDSGPPDPNSIVAVIRDATFLQELKRLGATTTTNRVVSEPLAAEIHVLYASDREGGIAYLSEGDRLKLNLELPALRKLAMANLKRLLPELKRHGAGPVFLLVADGNYESSLLLAEKLWDDQASVVQGNIVAAVPTRDVLMFTGSKSSEGIQELRAAVKKIHAEGSHAISKTLLVRRNGQWEQFSD